MALASELGSAAATLDATLDATEPAVAPETCAVAAAAATLDGTLEEALVGWAVAAATLEEGIQAIVHTIAKWFVTKSLHFPYVIRNR